MRDVERYIILAVVDQRWRGHLDGMDYLREGVHLRAFAQKDPLVEYRSEGHAMFEALGQTIREEIVLTLFHAQVEVQPEQLQPEQGNGNLQYEHETTAGSEAIAGAATAGGASAVAGSSATTALAVPQTATNEHRDIGRNDPCWCGSGKKFKKCHGA
jgi:preprotein translocase subunit SecA